MMQHSAIESDSIKFAESSSLHRALQPPMDGLTLAYALFRLAERASTCAQRLAWHLKAATATNPSVLPKPAPEV